MSTTLLIILILLQVKHWYIDFVNQTDEEVKHKGIYLSWKGMKHSLKHGLATFLIFFLIIPFEGAVVLGFIDFVLHYHIDWMKMRFGNRDITTKAFWAQLGADQLAHQLTYLGLASLIVI